MGVDTLRQSLLLGKPQRTLNKLWMMPQTKDGTNGNKNSNCLNGYFLFPQYVDVFWLFSCPPLSGPHSMCVWHCFSQHFSLHQALIRLSRGTGHELWIGKAKSSKRVHWMIIAWVIFLILCMYYFPEIMVGMICWCFYREPDSPQCLWYFNHVD